MYTGLSLKFSSQQKSDYDTASLIIFYFFMLQEIIGRNHNYTSDRGNTLHGLWHWCLDQELLKHLTYWLPSPRKTRWKKQQEYQW